MNDLLLNLRETGHRVERMEGVQQKQVNNDDAGEFGHVVVYDELLTLFRVSLSCFGSGSRSKMERHQRPHFMLSRNSAGTARFCGQLGSFDRRATSAMDIRSRRHWQVYHRSDPLRDARWEALPSRQLLHIAPA
jgi:hypothetical protein